MLTVVRVSMMPASLPVLIAWCSTDAHLIAPSETTICRDFAGACVPKAASRTVTHQEVVICELRHILNMTMNLLESLVNLEIRYRGGISERLANISTLSRISFSMKAGLLSTPSSIAR